MNFTVIWVPDAENELMVRWMNAPDRDAVTKAAHEIDSELRRHPGDVGESRPDGRRIMLVSPLGVYYRIDHGSRIVVVSHLWEYKRRRDA